MIRINKYATKTVTEGMSIELNPEDFRNLKNPYTGESDEDFVEYLDEIEETYYEEENLSDEIGEKLESFFDFSGAEIVDDSSDKGQDFDTVIVEEDTWDATTFEWLIERM